MTTAQSPSREKFSFSSSIAADVWTPKRDTTAYEWWYFDASSDDGRDQVVIIFLDNFVFSPRYNKMAARGAQSDGPTSAVPALAFFYYRDGKPLYRAINEFRPEEFSASASEPQCRIGENEFHIASAPYGTGYVINLKLNCFGGKKIEASFEWVGIESDFTGGTDAHRDETHNWNLVMPRADVSGRVRLLSRAGREAEVVHFRGTGYHDHNFDNRWLADTVRDWQWGRAHFNDVTAVFYRFTTQSGDEVITRLFTVRDGELRDRHASYTESQFKRNIFGVKYPQIMTFATDDGMSLSVDQSRVIDASFFYLRLTADFTLTLRDGKTREMRGITEFLDPNPLRWRFLDWMISMRIGTGQRGALIK